MDCVIFIGLQGVGKSTFYQQQFSKTHLRLNLDMLNKSRWREDILLKAFVEAKQSFVVDNTNPTITAREKYISLAKQKHFKVVAYYFDVPFELALAQNNQRIGKECIPEQGLRSVFMSMQKPSQEEGFDEIYVITNSEQQFVIENII